MKKEVVFSGLLLGAIGSFGYLMGNSNKGKVIKTISYEEKEINKSVDLKQRIPAAIKGNNLVKSVKKDISLKTELYSKNKYFNNLLKDNASLYLFKKSIEKFKGSQFKEDFAAYVTLGTQFDSSNEFGQIYMATLAKLNENPELAVDDLEKSLSSLSSEDSFMRSQILNLVNNLNLENERRVSFFGKEAIREVVLDKSGDFSPDSLNITTSLTFLSHSEVSNEEVLDIYKRSLANNTNSNVKKRLKVRFENYFPETNFDDI